MSDPSNDAALDFERLSAIAARGIRSEADVAWFISPSGWLAYCAAIAAGGPATIAPDAADDALAEIDDRLAPVAGTSVAARGRALLAVATSDDPAGRTEAVRALAQSVCAHPDVAAMAMAAAEGCAAFLHRQATPARPFAAVVPFAVSTHSAGHIARLEVAGGQGDHDLAPDLVAAPFQRCDAEFLRAIAAARDATRVTGSYRFVATSSRTGLPLDTVVGRSVGLAAAVALVRATKEAPFAPDPTWVFTGDIAADGRVVRLADATSPGAYTRKLEAVANRTLVLPADDLEIVDELVTEHAVTPLPVASLSAVEEAIARHRRGEAAYEQAVHGRRRSRWLIAGATAAAAVSLLAGWRANRDEALTSNQRRARAANPLRPVADPGGLLEAPVQLARTEVTNAMYALCIDDGVCESASGKTGVDSAESSVPVVNVNVSHAQSYCIWAYGAKAKLPSFEELKAALAQATDQFPFGNLDAADYAPDPDGASVLGIPFELTSVTDTSVDPTEFAFVAGNAAEWTRSACTDACTPVPDVDQHLSATFRPFGLSFEMAQVLETKDWLDVNAPDFRLIPTKGQPDIGFRCVTSA